MKDKTPHTSGTSAPHSERIGGPEAPSAGKVRMAGDIYDNPQARKTKMRPAGGKFEGGANSYKPPKMSTYSEE